MIQNVSTCQARCLQKHIKLNTKHIYLRVKGTRLGARRSSEQDLRICCILVPYILSERYI